MCMCSERKWMHGPRVFHLAASLKIRSGMGQCKASSAHQQDACSLGLLGLSVLEEYAAVVARARDVVKMTVVHLQNKVFYI